MSKDRRLGRGLEALLARAAGRTDAEGADQQVTADAAEPAQATSQSPQASGAEPDRPPEVEAEAADGRDGPRVEELPVGPDAVETRVPERAGPRRLDMGRIDSNPSQPRQEFDPAEMQSLAESIANHGLLQPVVVRQVEDRYQLIAGERRLRAARQAGWNEVPANVIEADDRETAELAIIENLQRKDLNPLEKAAAFERYLDVYGCTQEELAGRLRLDRSTVANLIRLLELPEPVQDAVRNGRITQGHARALLPLGEEREQIAFCQRIEREGLNVRQTETLVQETIETADRGPLGVVGSDGQRSRRRPRSEHILALEQELRSALGTKVSISHNARGRGRMIIHFRSHEEFERLRRHLHGGRAEGEARVG